MSVNLSPGQLMDPDLAQRITAHVRGVSNSIPVRSFWRSPRARCWPTTRRRCATWSSCGRLAYVSRSTTSGRAIRPCRISTGSKSTSSRSTSRSFRHWGPATTRTAWPPTWCSWRTRSATRRSAKGWRRQFKRMRSASLGCRFAQGYHLGRPLNMSAPTSLLRSESTLDPVAGTVGSD